MRCSINSSHLVAPFPIILFGANKVHLFLSAGLGLLWLLLGNGATSWQGKSGSHKGKLVLWCLGSTSFVFGTFCFPTRVDHLQSSLHGTPNQTVLYLANRKTLNSPHPIEKSSSQTTLAVCQYALPGQTLAANFCKRSPYWLYRSATWQSALPGQLESAGTSCQLIPCLYTIHLLHQSTLQQL